MKIRDKFKGIKHKYLRRCLIASALAVSLFAGSKVYYATTIDAELSGMKAELVTTGTAPFNDKDGEGFDSSATNNIIRSYDEATYDFTVALNGKDPNKAYDVEVTAKLPDVNEDNKLRIRWLTTNFAQGDAYVNKQGSEMTFYIRNLRPGQIYTKSLIAEVKAMDDGEVIKPEFTAKIKGDFPGKQITGTADKDMIVSAKTNLDVDLKPGQVLSMQEVDGKVGRVVPFGIDFKSKGEEVNGGKGNAFPNGDIELIMDLETTKVKIKTKEETPVDLDTKPVGTLEVGTNDKFGNQIRVEYGIGTGPSNEGSTHCYKSGNAELTKIGPKKYRLLLKNYSVGDKFPRLYWGSSAGGNPEARDYTAAYKYFASHVFEIFVPLIEEKDNSYDIRTKLKISEVNFSDSKGKHTMDSYEPNNERTMVVPDYLPGSYSMNNYTDDMNGKTLDRPFWSGQNGRVLQSGGQCRIMPYFSFHNHPSPLEGLKGGVTMVTFFPGNKLELMNPSPFYLSNANHNPVKTVKTWYGVGKMTEEQIKDTATPESVLTWYPSFEEAKKHEDPSKGIYIFGIKSDCTDNLYATGNPQLYQQNTVRVRKENTKPFERVFSKARATAYLDKERTKPIEVNKEYIPAEYDHNGDIVKGTQVPSTQSGGASFQLIPYEANIVANSYNAEDKEQTVFDLSRGTDVEWKITPTINTGGKGGVDDVVTVIHTIPKGEEYKDNSSNIKPKSINKLDNGSTELTWEFPGYDPGVGLPVITYTSNIPITTTDRTQLHHKTVIRADGDKRIEKEFRTATNTLTVVNDASVRINKTVSAKTVEIDEGFSYRVSLANNSKRDYNQGRIIDVLPFNGDSFGSNYQGTFIVTALDKVDGVKVEYTNQDPHTIKRNPNDSGVTDWKELPKGRSNTQVTALRITYNDIKAQKEYPITLDIKPKGNSKGNLYVNQAHGSVEGLDFAIYSGTVKTEVIARDITGTVWYDQNNNGTITDDEQKLEGIKVTLMDKSDKVLKSTYTGAHGVYTFTDLKPGEYKVKFGEEEGGLRPTQVITPPTENSNHILSRTLVSSPFTLTKTDKVKRVNLGVVSGVRLEKSVDKLIANVGETVTYKLKAINKGGFRVGETTVTDRLPEQLDVVTGTISDGGVYDKAEHKIVWKIKDLGSDETREVKFDAVIKKGAAGKLRNVASVKPYHKIPESPSNPTELAILTYHKSSSIPKDTIMKPGQELTYTIDITNESSVDAKDVLVEDNIPSGTELVEGSISDSGKKSLLGDKITWHVNVPAKGKKTVTFKVKALKPDNELKEIRNVAVVNGNATNEVLNKVGKPIVSLEKFVDKKTARERDTIVYNIKVKNDGTVESGNITLTDIVPAGSTLVNGSITEGGNLNHSTITWNLGKLAPKSSKTVSFRVTANNLPGDTLTYDIINQATLQELSVNSITSNRVVTTVNKPKLETSKSVNKTERVTVGNELEYSITVRNVGTASQLTTNIEDSLPQHIELVDNSISDSGRFEDGKVKWTLSELQPGEEKTVKFKVRTLANGDKLNWTVTNKALVNGKETNVVSNEVGVPKLVFNKQVNKTKATEGDILTYTISVTNQGKFSSYNVEVKDTVPQGTELVEGQKTSWTIPELREGQTETVSFKVKVSKLPADVTEINIPNKALVNGKETNEVSTLVQIPKLEFRKSSSVPTDNKLNVGDEIEYSIIVHNTGSASALNVEVEDSIPTGTELKSKGEASKSLFSNKLNWTIDEIKPGASKTIKFSVTTKDMSTDNQTLWTVRNIAKVNEKDTNEVTNKVAVPKLSISKVVNNKVAREGDELVYTLTIKNTGSIDSAMAKVEDILPEGVEHIEGGTYDSNSRKVTWDLDTIGEGETKTLTCKARVSKLEGSTLEKELDNKATLTEKSEIVSNKVTTVVKKPSLEYKKERSYDTMRLTVGDKITYRITVKNKGTIDEPVVKIKDVLDEGLEYVDNSATEGGIYDKTTRTLSWTTNKLEPNQVKVYEFKARTIANKDANKVLWKVTNKALVNNKETNVVEDEVGIPNVAIEKFVNRKDLLTLGEYLQYDIRVTNTGTRTARDIEVKDSLPKQIEYVNASEQPRVIDSRNIYWNVRNLAPGESKTINLQVKTVALDGFKDEFHNKALATLKDIGAVKTVESNDVKSEIAIPNLVVKKKAITDKEGTLAEGDKIKYVIEVVNEGKYVAKDVRIADKLPEGLTLVEGKPNASLGDIKPGETKEINFSGTIDKFDQGVYTKEFVNKAAVSSTTQTLETNQVSNLAQKGELRYSKTSDVAYDSEVLEGQEIEYTINVSNIGDAPIKNVVVKDSIPKGTSLVNTDGVNKDNTIEWNLTEIAPKQELVLKVKVKVEPLKGNDVKSTIENVALVNNNKTNVVVHHVVKPKLVSVKFAEKPSNTVVLAGDEIKYSVTTRNIGTADAKNIVVKDVIPAGVTLVEDSIYDKGVYDKETNTVTWTLDTVPKNNLESKTVSFKVRVNEGEDREIRNVALVNDKETNEVKHYVKHERLDFIKSVDKEIEVTVGQELTYTIKVTNNGTVDMKNIMIEDAVPEHTKLVKILNNGSTGDNKKLLWSLKELKIGETKEVSFVVEVKKDTKDKTIIPNTALVNGMETNRVETLVLKEEPDAPPIEEIGKPEPPKPPVVPETKPGQGVVDMLGDFVESTIDKTTAIVQQGNNKVNNVLDGVIDKTITGLEKVPGLENITSNLPATGTVRTTVKAGVAVVIASGLIYVLYRRRG